MWALHKWWCSVLYFSFFRWLVQLRENVSTRIKYNTVLQFSLLKLLAFPDKLMSFPYYAQLKERRPSGNHGASQPSVSQSDNWQLVLTFVTSSSLKDDLEWHKPTPQTVIHANIWFYQENKTGHETTSYCSGNYCPAVISLNTSLVYIA